MRRISFGVTRSGSSGKSLADAGLCGMDYHMTLNLPVRKGRHVLYVIWQRIDPVGEVFFSTSDLDFGGVDYGPTPAPMVAPPAADDGHTHPTPTPTPVPTPTPTPVPGAGNVTVEFPQATVTFKVTNDWKTGFQGDVSIRNKTNQPLRDWKLAFVMDRQIASIWNARVAGREGALIRFDSSTFAWNKDVPAGGTVTFGFTEIRALLNNRSAFPAQGSTAFSLRYFVDLTELFSAGYKETDVAVTANYVQNGRVAPALKVHDAARKIYYVDVDFNGTLIQPGTGTSFRREAQFRMTLKSGIPASAWNPANDPSFSGLPTGGANVIKSNAIPVYENAEILSGRVP